MDSLNANASKLRAFKARETLGEIVKRVYELIETEHEEEKISGYGNILVYKSRIHPQFDSQLRTCLESLLGQIDNAGSFPSRKRS